jgi:hypothetical protein
MLAQTFESVVDGDVEAFGEDALACSTAMRLCSAFAAARRPEAPR